MKRLLIPITLLFILFSQSVTAANKANLAPAPMQKSQSVKRLTHQQEIGVWLHQLDLSLYQDLDSDGFSQNLRLTLDLDTNVTHRDVIVELWLASPDSYGERVYRSDHFSLNHDAYDDAKQIDIQFIDDYREDYYALELRIVDYVTGSEIFTIDQYDVNKLGGLMIEGQRYDQEQIISIYSADIDLYNDDNYNGYYHQVSVSFDVDVPYGSASLIAEFYIDDQLVHTSHAFEIIGSRTSDKQYFDLEMLSGLAPGYYDLDIHLIDAHDHRRRHRISALDWIVFNNLPLESYYWDHYQGDDIEVGVEQHAASLGMAIFGLMLIGLWRRIARF